MPVVFLIAPNLARKCMTRLVFPTVLLALHVPVGCLAGGVYSVPPAAKVELQVETAPGMQSEWAVQRGRLEENAINSYIYLTVENRSDHPVRDAFFYAELFDREGRFCFSALFRLGENLERHHKPLEPGGVRTLFSLSSDLASVAEPQVIRIYRAYPGPPESEKSFSAPVPVRIPVTVVATGVPGSPGWQTLSLVSLVGQYDAPVLDLALAVADVDSQGRPTSFRVIDARDATTRSWVNTLVEHLLFRPASEGFLPRRGQTLILVRTVLRRWKDGEPVFNPRTNPWARDFLEAFQGTEMPAINILMLDPCQADASSAGPGEGQGGDGIPGCVQYFGVGTDWSLGLWKPRPSRSE